MSSDSWKRVESLVQENYDKPDIEAAKIIYSAVAAHQIKDCLPAWLMPTAPPGSMKTDLLESLRGLPKIHFVDEITTNTFLSGKVEEPGRKRKRSPSLLHRIGDDGIVISADFSTFSSSDFKSLSVVLSQLRRIYDGNYSHEFGTDENLEERSWSGRLTIVAGATSTIDRHWLVSQQLGERFLRVRWPRAGGVQAALTAISHRRRLIPQLREAVRTFLLPVLTKLEGPLPTVPQEIAVRIASLSEIVALARAYVHRDSTSREIAALPEPESNTRLPQQLIQLGNGWAILNGRAILGEEEFSLIERAALDSMPPIRRQIILATASGVSPYSVSVSGTTGVLCRAVEDLKAVGILAKNGDKIMLSEYAKSLILQAKPTPRFPVLDSEELTTPGKNGGSLEIDLPSLTEFAANVG